MNTATEVVVGGGSAWVDRVENSHPSFVERYTRLLDWETGLTI